MTKRFTFLTALIIAAATATGCGGSSTPAATNTTTGSGTTVTFPTSGIITSATFTFPASGVSGSLSTTATSGTGPAPKSSERQTLAASAVSTWQLQFTGATGTLTFSSAPTLTIATPSGSSGTGLVLEIFDSTQTGIPLVYTWTASNSGTNTVFTGTAGQTLNLADTYWFEIVGGSTSTAGGPLLPGPGTSSSLTYTFGGSSTGLTFGTTAVTQASLSAYQGITVALQTPSITGSGTLTLSDALNNGDVSPNTLPADNAVSGYTPVVYLAQANAASSNVSLSYSGSTTLTVTSTTSFATKSTCRLDAYAPNGGSFSWQTAAPVVGSQISGNTLTFTIYQNPGTVSATLPSGQQIMAVACQ